MLPRVRGRRQRDSERKEQHPLEQEVPHTALRFVGFHTGQYTCAVKPQGRQPVKNDPRASRVPTGRPVSAHSTSCWRCCAFEEIRLIMFAFANWLTHDRGFRSRSWPSYKGSEPQLSAAKAQVLNQSVTRLAVKAGTRVPSRRWSVAPTTSCSHPLLGSWRGTVDQPGVNSGALSSLSSNRMLRNSHRCVFSSRFHLADLL